MITLEDKIRIVARNFFTDNPDDYEDYHEALAEFMNRQNTSDKFIEFGADFYTKPEEGSFIFTREDGHVCSVREKDGFFQPRTEMSEEEAEIFVSQVEDLLDKEPELEGNAVELMKRLGWKRIA